MECTQEQIDWTMKLIKDNKILNIKITSATPDIDDFFNPEIDGDDVKMNTKILIDLDITKWPKSLPKMNKKEGGD